MNILSSRFLPGLLLALLLTTPTAQATPQDRKQPVNIEADRVSVDDRNKVHIFEGDAHLEQGSLILRGERIVVTQDANGFQQGVASGTAKQQATFSQQRPGRDDKVNGQADRIEYDGRTEIARMFGNARVTSGNDEVRGDYIEYNGLADNYAVNSGAPASGSSKPAGRVSATIPPRAPAPTN